MDNYIYKALNKYFSTLSKVGYIKQKDAWGLLMVNHAYSIYKIFKNLVTKEDIEIFNDFIECKARNNCLFVRSVPYLTYVDSIGDAIQTIITEDDINTIAGSTVVAANRKTQKFTDFEVRTEIQGDNYVVGYDASDNKEVAVNVNNLGVFWDVDI